MTHRNDDPCNPSFHPSFVFDSAICDDPRPRSLHSDEHNVRPLFMLTNAPFRFVVRLSATPPHSLFIFISLPHVQLFPSSAFPPLSSSIFSVHEDAGKYGAPYRPREEYNRTFESLFNFSKFSVAFLYEVRKLP